MGKEKESIGLQMKYFVLKPKGNDVYAEASQLAMLAYAKHISNENPQLSEELSQWAKDEHYKVIPPKE